MVSRLPRFEMRDEMLLILYKIYYEPSLVVNEIQIHGTFIFTIDLDDPCLIIKCRYW